VALSFLGISALSAQPREQPELISLDFKTLRFGPPIEALKFDDGETVQTIGVSTNSLGNARKYRGPNPIVFFRERETNDPENPIERVPVASVRVPEGMSEALVLFIVSNSGSSPQRIQTRVIDASRSSFDQGEMQFLNFSPLAVGCMIGENRFTIDPGEREVIAPEPVEDLQVVRMAFFDDEWQSFKRTAWRLPDRERIWVIVSQDPDSGLIRVAAIPEFF